ncbi:hypothetical protein GcC1_132028 [Golovinomyces cichoracearum]|uniref:Uncharacterized protein n=1 Tax=Golovinomyces cichoracearum TaxID=62708 RepID=A0A420I3X2_9PEZI|nr:hypothetical protein GcC1_132028 [Golovinomyces cichoracearum]
MGLRLEKISGKSLEHIKMMEDFMNGPNMSLQWLINHFLKNSGTIFYKITSMYLAEEG